MCDHIQRPRLNQGAQWASLWHPTHSQREHEGGKKANLTISLIPTFPQATAMLRSVAHLQQDTPSLVGAHLEEVLRESFAMDRPPLTERLDQVDPRG